MSEGGGSDTETERGRPTDRQTHQDKDRQTDRQAGRQRH